MELLLLLVLQARHMLLFLLTCDFPSVFLVLACCLIFILVAPASSLVCLGVVVVGWGSRCRERVARRALSNLLQR